jgi:acyl-CoA synthetase (AMP-forming)/AMP-acid ligase II
MQLVSAWQLDERDVALVAVPLFHVTGLGQMLTAQLSGGSSVIMAKFDPGSAPARSRPRRRRSLPSSRPC